jgi:hypothetical protein
MNLVKAQLVQVTFDEKNKTKDVPNARNVAVQFNPDSLKVSLSNQLSGSDQSGASAIQYVGSGTSKLSFDLWFDVTNPEHTQRPVGKNGGKTGEIPDDVRKLTREVAFFIEPKKDDKDPKKYIPPGVRFIWGTFLFDGIMESYNEELSYFSEDGRPLRSKVSVSLTQRQIKFDFSPEDKKNKPKQQAQQNDTAADVAARGGNPENWPAMAASNGIENPRFVPPGTVLDTSAAAGIGGVAGAGFSAGAALGASGGFSAGASVAGGVGGNLGFGGAASGAGFGASAAGSLGGGLRAGAAAGAGIGGAAGIGGGAGIGAGVGGGFGGGLGAGGGIGVGASVGFGGGATAGVGATAGFSAGAGTSLGGFATSLSRGVAGVTASVSAPTVNATIGGAASSATAKAHASFDLRLRR